MSQLTKKSKAVDLKGLSVAITEIGSTTRVRVHKDSPLTAEESMQLQILEQLRYAAT